MKFSRIFYILCLSTLLSCGARGSVIRDGLARQKSGNIEETPRINIKVFRSPTKEERGEQYATWGFWIKQPAELS